MNWEPHILFDNIKRTNDFLYKPEELVFVIAEKSVDIRNGVHFLTMLF